MLAGAAMELPAFLVNCIEHLLIPPADLELARPLRSLRLLWFAPFELMS